MTFTTFIRSARNFEEFARAEKQVQETGLTIEQARKACLGFNQNRTDAQKEVGTMMEFTADENI